MRLRARRTPISLTGGFGVALAGLTLPCIRRHKNRADGPATVGATPAKLRPVLHAARSVPAGIFHPKCNSWHVH